MRRSIMLVLLLLFSGCAFQTGITESQVQTKRDVLETAVESRIVSIHQETYMGATRVRINRETLPPIFDQEIAFNERGTLPQLTASLSAETGLLISVHGQQTQASPEGSPVPGATGRLDADLREALGAAGPGAPALRITYSGPVRGLLDNLGSRFGVSWEYDEGGGISFYPGNVQTFTLWAAPGRVSFTNTITNESRDNVGGGAGSGMLGASSSQETAIQTAQSHSTELSFDIWLDVEAEVKNFLTASGTVSINQAAGTITVRDAPFVLRQVKNYIDGLNERLSRQIALSIKVWALEVSDSASAGLNLSIFFENPDVRVFAGTSPLQVLGVGGDLSAAVVDGRLKDTTALLQGLRRIGNATQLTSGSGLVMNNQSMPVQAIRREAYLASAERTQSDYGETTSLVPSEITTGFSMAVIPHILENRRVVLQYTVNLSSLDDLVEFSSGESSIQLPRVSTRSFSNRMTIRMGQTLVLAGFEQEIDGRGTAGGIFGFGRARDYTRSLIIITISTESGEV